MRNTWLYSCLLLVACGGPMPMSLSPRELCEGIQKAHCARLYQCVTTPAGQAVLKAMYADQNDCVMQGINMQKPVCSEWSEANVCGVLGSSAWNGSAAPTCLTDLNALACTKTVIGTLPGSCTPGDYCL